MTKDRTMKRRPGYSIEHDSWFIPLTRGVIALIDPDMVPILSQKNWCVIKAKTVWKAMRAECSVRPHVSVYMHRVIMDAPDGKLVDHIIHYPMDTKLIDNRRKNLRLCTNKQNTRNRRPRRGCSSRYTGVFWHKKSSKWGAVIGVDGTNKFLGHFDSEANAVQARAAAEAEYFGEFAFTGDGSIPKQEGPAS